MFVFIYILGGWGINLLGESLKMKSWLLKRLFTWRIDQEDLNESCRKYGIMYRLGLLYYFIKEIKSNVGRSKIISFFENSSS